ncbi:hypothetical protein P691DRAFT_808929 [Macrolepiota fuliginosa MF-IS2]|uniref:Uncharacterized protein n=1 Tax=Macrolepiota fuliginosa MF-IS2 TaxID=1400762 RepID=A0A9P5XK85_9AGAR|nr:hypothetical protein P691DRAFT_808929 [Macrolepiota fuliginosa MF-IS2]
MMSSRMMPSSTEHSRKPRPAREHSKDEAGVCEAYPGIIESSDIEPLHHEKLKGDTSGMPSMSSGTASEPGYMAIAADTLAAAAKYAKAGKESIFGSSK